MARARSHPSPGERLIFIAEPSPFCFIQPSEMSDDLLQSLRQMVTRSVASAGTPSSGAPSAPYLTRVKSKP